ncbi:MAG: YbbR-like domain-containing protein [Lentimicrobiaceae bacterium]|nr:YbbR-like domain-containing protein [Lentimicrobiaceae bacterium]
MKELIPFLFRRNRKPMDGKLREKLSVFLFCLFFSVIMWGLIKLSHEYDVTYKYRIQPTGMPENMVLVSQPDSVLSVSIRGSGVELYRRLFSSRMRNLPLSLEGGRVKFSNTHSVLAIRASSLRPQLVADLPAGAIITGLEPDTLRFIFKPSYSKLIPVLPQLKLQFVSQYQLYDSVQLIPDSVMIMGMREIVDTIRQVYTEQKNFRGLNEDVTARLSLIVPESYPPVRLMSDSITVKLKVEKFTEAQILLPVRLEAGEHEISYRLFPENVKVTCRVSLRDYDKLDASLFSAVVYYQDIHDNPNTRIPVEIVNKPDFVRIIRIDPDKIEYLIMQ